MNRSFELFIDFATTLYLISVTLYYVYIAINKLYQKEFIMKMRFGVCASFEKLPEIIEAGYDYVEVRVNEIADKTPISVSRALF